MQNLISRTGKIHARLASVSTWYLCQSGARFGGPVSAGTTDNPVTCQRCRAILAYRGSVDSLTVASGQDFSAWTDQQLRSTLEALNRVLANPRRYRMTKAVAARLGGERDEIQQALAERARDERVSSGSQ